MPRIERVRFPFSLLIELAFYQRTLSAFEFPYNPTYSNLFRPLKDSNI